MSVTFGQITALAQFTIADPLAGARQVLAMRLPMVARWWLIAFVAVVSALLAHVSLSLLPPETMVMIASSVLNPISSALGQGLYLVVVALAIHRIGRWRGGIGSFSDTLLLVGWMHTILLAVMAAEIVAQLILPPLAVGISLLGIGLFMWLLTSFITELHGFKSRGWVFLGILGTIFGLAMIIAFALSSLSPAGA